jgi:predicted dehydrogenase
MEKIKWGIIGCGDVTEIKSGPAFNKVSNSTLIAVMRRDGVKAKDYAQRHGVPKWYDNANDLINDEEVNAIYIATPPASHAEYAIKCIDAGKPVYIEKPMALNAAEAKNVADHSLKKNIQMVVAHYRREQPLFKKIKELIDSNEIGDIRHVKMELFKKPLKSELVTSANWRIDPAQSGGGLFHDLAPHQLDLMYYFFGEIKEVFGIGVNQASLYVADDLVTGSILFENKIVFNGTWCFTVSEYHEKDICEIIGSNGKITFSVFEGNVIRVEKNGQEEILTFPSIQHVQQPMIEAVVKYFLHKDKNPCSGKDGVVVMNLLDQFTRKVKF